MPTLLFNRRCPSGNWPATLAAVRARGPRCDRCGTWTCRPYLLAEQSRRAERLCAGCESARAENAR